MQRRPEDGIKTPPEEMGGGNGRGADKEGTAEEIQCRRLVLPVCILTSVANALLQYVKPHPVRRKCGRRVGYPEESVAGRDYYGEVFVMVKSTNPQLPHSFLNRKKASAEALSLRSILSYPATSADDA